MKKNYLLLTAACLAVASTAIAATPRMDHKGRYIAKSLQQPASARQAQKAPPRIVNVTPKALPATDITENAFTANWEGVAGADGYCMFVYEPVKITEPGTYAIVDESFNLVNVGSTVEPVWADDTFYTDISEEYDYTFTPDWSGVGVAFARGMVSANLYSPTMALEHNGGKFKVTIELVANQGTILSVTSINGDGVEQEKRQTTTQPGGQTLEFEFTNGTHETWLYMVDEGIEGDDDGQYANVLSWFDQITVSQELQAGDEVLRLVDIDDYISVPVTSRRFENMKYLYGATELAYDFYAAYVYENDPDDDWDDEKDYSNFSNLQKLQLLQTGIEGIDAAGDDAPARYYNLQGVPVANPEPGQIYIRTQNDRSSKVRL